MEPSDLHKLWASPDNSRLTAKQYSFRLPVHVAAKILALCELFPTRTRTEIVGDLLSAALEQVERSLPIHETDEVVLDGPEGPIHRAFGPRIDFREIANRNYADLEREAGNENPGTLY